MTSGKSLRSEPIPYPSSRWMKFALDAPILLYRLGLGPVVGRLFMILTTTGRTSGLPRRIAIEYHARQGRKYVVSAWGERAQWYKNLLADPHVTIQTANGAESVIARRVTSDAELTEAYRLLEYNPFMRRWVEALGVRLDLDAFLAHKDRFHLVTFDPTDAPTPPPLEADLKWVWEVVISAVALGWLMDRVGRRR